MPYYILTIGQEKHISFLQSKVKGYEEKLHLQKAKLNARIHEINEGIRTRHRWIRRFQIFSCCSKLLLNKLNEKQTEINNLNDNYYNYQKLYSKKRKLLFSKFYKYLIFLRKAFDEKAQNLRSLRKKINRVDIPESESELAIVVDSIRKLKREIRPVKLKIHSFRSDAAPLVTRDRETLLQLEGEYEKQQSSCILLISEQERINNKIKSFIKTRSSINNELVYGCGGELRKKITDQLYEYGINVDTYKIDNEAISDDEENSSQKN